MTAPSVIIWVVFEQKRVFSLKHLNRAAEIGCCVGDDECIAKLSHFMSS